MEKIKIDAETGCWIWIAAVSVNGRYAMFSAEREQHAHRFAYREKTGQIPKGVNLKRTCDSLLCCNPTHWELSKSSRRRALNL